MIEMQERPDLRELVAVAANTDDLTPEGGDALMIGALGAACIDRRRAMGLSARPSEDKARLGALLERAKFAGDEKAERQAVLVFAYLVSYRAGWLRKLRIGRGDPKVLALAGVVVAEWVHDQCPNACVNGVLMLGNPGQRNFRPIACRKCDGNGKRRIDHAARAQALGVPVEVYERAWRPVIWRATGVVREVEADILERLRRQNLRGMVRAVGN